jgi:5'-3' exonuclease
VNVRRLAEVVVKLTKFEQKAIGGIVHQSPSSVLAEKSANEICDTEELVLQETRVRAEPSGKEQEDGADEMVGLNQDLKSEYYEAKFGETNASEIVAEYVRGLCWVLRYYTLGCPSWGWFYPFFYPPCASDLAHCDGSGLDDFVLGEPFKPLVQLMAVLPPQSAHALPAKMQELVVSPDSPLHDYFPVRFRVDLCGQRKTWKGVVLIPFIDASLLLETIENTDLELTPEELERNQMGRTRIYTDGSGFGPQFWGSLEKVHRNDYFFEYPIVSENQDLAFVLLGAKPPPDVLGNAVQFEKRQKRFPLQIPGYPPGEAPEFRAQLARPKRTGVSAFLF